MDWRNLAYWVVEVAGTFVCIAAFINIVLGGHELLSFVAVFVLGVVIVIAGLPLRPRPLASVR